MKTTGKYSEKSYKCSVCGHVKEIGTNHWGECYSLGSDNACPVCPPFKRPTVWVCMEEPPKGVGKPEPWQVVKLGDLLKKEPLPCLDATEGGCGWPNLCENCKTNTR